MYENENDNGDINEFEKLTGDSRLPLNYDVASPEVYFEKENYFSQVAGIDGGNYIDFLC